MIENVIVRVITKSLSRKRQTIQKRKEIGVLYETLLVINVILGRILKNDDSSREQKSLQKASTNSLVSLKLMAQTLSCSHLKIKMDDLFPARIP